MSDKTIGAPQRNRTYALLAPGVIWMTLFLIVPLGMMIYVSFWTQTTFSISSDLTLKSWKTFFASETYFGALLRTLRIWLTVLAVTFIIGYPAALFIGQLVRNKTTQTILLVACVIPFWTSFLIRVLAWRPMLGKEGAINIPLYFIRLKLKTLDPGTKYVVCCDTGRRSSAGAYILSERGFDTYVLEGGLTMSDAAHEPD